MARCQFWSGENERLSHEFTSIAPNLNDTKTESNSRLRAIGATASMAKPLVERLSCTLLPVRVNDNSSNRRIFQLKLQ